MNYTVAAAAAAGTVASRERAIVGVLERVYFFQSINLYQQQQQQQQQRLILSSRTGFLVSSSKGTAKELVASTLPLEMEPNKIPTTRLRVPLATRW